MTMMLRLIYNFHKVRPDMLSPPQDASTGGPHFKMYDTLWDNSYSSGEVAVKIESGGKPRRIPSLPGLLVRASPWSTMRRQVSLPFLLSFLTLSLSSSIRLKRQLNFGPQKSTEDKQRPTNKVFFGLPNPFGSNIGGSTGSTCSCATGGDPGGETVTAPRLGRVCNCATSVEFGGDCKGRGQGDRWDFREKLFEIFFAGFLGAVVADLATGSLRFPREKGGKLDLEENKLDSQEKKRHKRGSSM